MKIELLSSNHNRKGFQCGVELLDNYLHNQANQDIKRKLSACFVCTNSSGEILGYYTLSKSSVSQESITEHWIKSLPILNSSIPLALLRRFAVNNRYVNQGVGELMLIDAIKRCNKIYTEIKPYAIVSYISNEMEVQFYLKYGFIIMPDSNKMILCIRNFDENFLNSY